jgi:hypothetical protein
VSEGHDSMSDISFKKLRDHLKKTDVVLYCIGLSSDPSSGSALGMEGQGVLDELASVTGGRAMFLPPRAKSSDLSKIFDFISLELRSQYRISINPGVKGEWIKIKVNANHKDKQGKKMDLLTRYRESFYY